MTSYRHPRRTRPGTSDYGQRMREWSGVVHGPGWELTRSRYWRNPRTKKACVWRGRGPCSGPASELNHLTYRFSSHGGRHGAGWVPWPWYRVALRPMCSAHHDQETALTRRLRPGMKRSRQKYAHAYVTYRWIWSRVLIRWVLLPAAVVAVLLLLVEYAQGKG